MKQDFLYNIIADKIKSRIFQGRYHGTGLLPTTNELAKEFETSPMTIHKALDKLVQENLITRAPGKGTYINVKSDENNNDKKKSSGIVGAIVYDTSGHYLWSISLRGIEDALQANGYNLLLGNDDGDFNKALKYINDFSEKQIDGLIFVPIGYPTKKEYEEKNLMLIRRIEELNIPYILFHRFLYTENNYTLALDDYHDTLILINRFLQNRLSNPVCLSHYYTSCSADRERGFIDTLNEFGYPNPDQHVFRIKTDGQKVDTRVKDQITEFLQKTDDIDGIFTVENDILAITQDIINNSPEYQNRDIALCCFDYSDSIGSKQKIEIMDVPTYELGYYAGKLIHQRINQIDNIPYKTLISSILRN